MGTKVMGSGVTIASSPFLEPLTDALAEGLALRPADPFASEIVVVPNIGVRDWLQRELGSRLASQGRVSTAGIVANVRFMFVQQFLDTVFSASGAEFVEDWNIDHLTWFVHRAIDAIGRPSIPGAATRPLTVARVIADLFDRYGVHRPSMLRYWQQGRGVDAVEPLLELPEHLRWQQHLYTHVCRLIDAQSPAERLAGLEASIAESGLPENIPDRVALFGFVTVNSTMRAVIDAVGLARQCNVYLVHPRRHDIGVRPEGRSRLVLREHVVDDDVDNALLSRWGRAALETRTVLSGAWNHVEERQSESSRDLDRVRQVIVDDRPVTLVPVANDDERLDRGDGSLQIHSCHGRVRQVEVLRDALLHLLEDDPTLTLSDISIQCPDLESFAPIIPGIFRSGQPVVDGMLPPLDVSVADRVLVGDNPYLDAFRGLLELAQSRCGIGEVLSMLASSPIQRRFGVDDEDLARFDSWIESLGVKFGLDTEHRLAWNLPASIEVGTWESALNRLFMGLAVPAEFPIEGPGGVIPHDDISVTDASALARITDFLTLFRRLVTRIGVAHSVREWSDIFLSIIEDFFDMSETRDAQCRALLEAIDRLESAARRAGVTDDDRFEFAEISALVEDLVASMAGRPRFRSGAITVTELLPQQGVPYRVIALLGSNEAMFATGSVHGDDVLSLRPCLGDPMPSVSGRMQLLNVILAATDALIITCEGADINTNKPLPLPVPIQELLETIAALRTETSLASTVRIFTQHPRQSFATRALEPGAFRADRPFTFDRAALDLHTRRRVAPEPVLAGQRVDTRSHTEPTSVPTEMLRRAVAKPVEYFVHNVLGARLPPADPGSSSDVVDFWPSRLEIAQVGRQLLDGAMRSAADPNSAIGHVLQQMSMGGAFPPGRLGRMAADQVSAEVLSIFHLLPEDARHVETYRSIEFDDLALGPIDGLVDMSVTGSVDEILGHDLIRASFTRFREDLLLDPWVELALVGLDDPDTPWTVRMVARGPKGNGVARAFRLAGSNAQERHESAHRVLEVARTLMTCMSRGRVPYLPKTAEVLSHSSTESARSTYDSEFEYSIPTQFLFGRVTWDDFVTEPVRDGDPQGVGESRALRFARFVWDAFGDTTTPVAMNVGQDVPT